MDDGRNWATWQSLPFLPKPGGKLQMRWFVLEDAKLSYYKEKDAKTMVSPLRDPPLLVTSRSSLTECV